MFSGRVALQDAGWCVSKTLPKQPAMLTTKDARDAIFSKAVQRSLELCSMLHGVTSKNWVSDRVASPARIHACMPVLGHALCLHLLLRLPRTASQQCPCYCTTCSQLCILELVRDKPQNYKPQNRIRR